MHIAQFVNTLAVGGAEQLAVDLALELQSRGHTLTAIALHERGALADELERAGIEVLTLEKGRGLNWKTLSTFPRFLKAQGVEVLHSHNTHLHHLAVGAARLAGIRAVVNTVHGLVNVPESTRARLLYQTAAYATDRIVSVSHAVAEALKRELALPDRLVQVVYNGVDPARFAQLQRPWLKAEVVFGTIGRFVEVKNQAALIQAFSKVHAQHPATRLRIMGYGPLEQRLRELAQDLRLTGAIDFVDGHADTVAFLESIDVFVLASRSEGLPISLLEAMAAARPVIGTSVGGVPEVIAGGQCGWLVPEPEPESLAKVMNAAVEFDDRALLAENARLHVEQNFSRALMAAKYEAIFQRILGARGVAAAPA